MPLISSPDQDEVLSEINVTPLVDVMLVLLVVFIVTAPLLTNAIQVALPKTAHTTGPDAREAVTITVSPAGHLHVGKRAVDPAMLEQVLRKLRLTQPDLTLYLQADEAAQYGLVAKVMASIERAGVSKVAVITATE